MQRTMTRARISELVIPVSIEPGRVVSTALVTRDHLNEAHCGASPIFVQVGRIPPLFGIDIGPLGSQVSKWTP
jgi:hypothetical protein